MALESSTFSDADLDPRRLLQRELKLRCQNNPKYSLRAFARALGLSPTILSLVLSGKRRLSVKATTKLADHLGLNPLQRQLLLQKHPAAIKLVESSVPTQTLKTSQQIPLDTFELISDWQHYAILGLLELPGAELDARWVAQALNISHVEAQDSIDRLHRLKLLEQDATGRWRQSGAPIVVENTVSTPAARKRHKQILTKALHSLENDPVETRDFSGVTFAMSRKLVPYAREQIRAFRRKLMNELEQMQTPDTVYELNVQIFPLSKSLSERKKK